MAEAAPLERIVISGGLSRSDYLCRALAAATALPVERYDVKEATARGVAFLAAGEPAGWEVPPLERAFAPSCSPALAVRHAAWRAGMARRGAAA
jgi:glycerol kinase